MWGKKGETNPYQIGCFLTLANYISLTYEMGKEGETKTFPLQALRVPAGQGALISRIPAHEYCKVFSPTVRPPLFPHREIFLVLIYVRGRMNSKVTARLEGCNWKIQITRERSSCHYQESNRDLSVVQYISQSLY